MNSGEIYLHNLLWSHLFTLQRIIDLRAFYSIPREGLFTLERQRLCLYPSLEEKIGSNISSKIQHFKIPLLWHRPSECTGYTWLSLCCVVQVSETEFLLLLFSYQVLSDALQLLSVMDCSMQGLLLTHHLLEFAQVHVHRVGDVIQLCNPLPPSSPFQFSSVQFSRSVMSDSLWSHESQHARPPYPSPSPGVHSNWCQSSRWCHPAISSSVIPFSSCPQSLPTSGYFPMSQLFTSGGQSIGVSASASVFPMKTQDWSPLGWTGWISLQSKGPSSLLPQHS